MDHRFLKKEFESRRNHLNVLTEWGSGHEKRALECAAESAAENDDEEIVEIPQERRVSHKDVGQRADVMKSVVMRFKVFFSPLMSYAAWHLRLFQLSMNWGSFLADRKRSHAPIEDE
ncbi:unnamed protein product, partial [Cyprideis torosa]